MLPMRQKMQKKARKINDTIMCLFKLSLSDKDSQMALYNGKTTDLPGGDAAKVWKNLFKIVHAKSINKKSKLKGEIVKSTLYSAETNPEEWFA
jgi:hypothetical protein